MVILYYMSKYICFLITILCASENTTLECALKVKRVATEPTPSCPVEWFVKWRTPEITP